MSRYYLIDARTANSSLALREIVQAHSSMRALQQFSLLYPFLTTVERLTIVDSSVDWHEIHKMKQVADELEEMRTNSERATHLIQKRRRS